MDKYPNSKSKKYNDLANRVFLCIKVKKYHEYKINRSDIINIL